MVLTRLSHVGEDCPLMDHSYSDPIFSYSCPVTANRRIVQQPKVAEVPEVEDELPVASSASINVLEFPSEIIEKVFSYLSFKKVGEVRRVCKRFDKIGANFLNLAFQRLQKFMLKQFQATKSRMPRRESARRKHPLARESDILETLLMRLSLLQMTFGKHIERKNCCFFAGEILDEVYRILKCVKTTHNMSRVFKITDELFDLTAMAMEYFRDFIEPGLPEIFSGREDIRFSEDESSYYLEDFDDEFLESEPLPPSNMVLRKRLRKMKQGMKRYSNQITVIRRELRSCRNKISNQSKQVLEYLSRMEEQEKKVDDSTRKFDQLYQELSKCQNELRFWRSRFNSSSNFSYICNDCGNSSELMSSSEGLWNSRDTEDRLLVRSIAAPNIPSYQYTPLSLSPSPSIKNLEHWNDSDTFPTQSQPDSADIAISTISHAGVEKKPVPSPSFVQDFLTMEEKKPNFIVISHHKRLSSDDDTEEESDTVGKRVKSRKRARLEAH